VRKAIFLDRDGTLIVDKNYLADPSQVEYLPTTFEALRLLQDNGYEFVIVTNQSGVAKGLITPKQVEQIHLKMKQDLQAEGIFILGIEYCPAGSDSQDPRRKPNPGMILEAAEKYNIDRTGSWMVGDKLSDVEAGQRAGVTPIFLNTGKEPAPEGVPRFDTLLEATRFILGSALP
jgi:D-glycero-D-manno-heptose 1,7-bisphosphate phosphatase